MTPKPQPYKTIDYALVALCMACGKNYSSAVSTIIRDSQRCYKCWSDGKEILL